MIIKDRIALVSGGASGLGEATARHLALPGAKVGIIDFTPMMEALPEEVTDKITAGIPFQARLGNPFEYALTVEHIINNPFLNGNTIRLDGAVRLPPR